MYPTWWSVDKRSEACLQDLNIATTRALIIAASGTKKKAADATAPVSVSVKQLFRYCNSELSHLSLHVHKACDSEPDTVSVKGHNPYSIITHTPKEEKRTTQAKEEMSELAIHLDLYCPLTLCMFEDPVVCEDGHSYERQAIAKWLSSKQTSPLTGQAMGDGIMIPNLTLLKLVRAYEEHS